MPKGKTLSTMNLSQRREKAFTCFLQGWNNADVARELKVIPETVARYRAEYKEQIDQEARQNPRLLLEVVPNTVLSLHELEAVRKAAWDEFNNNRDRPAIRQQALRVLSSIQGERAKLLGLAGLKPEFLVHLQNVQHVQQRILDWMRTNLCPEDREKLARFLETEMKDFMGPSTDGGIIDVPEIPAGFE